MEPHLADAVYVNNLGVEGHTRVQGAYGANYDRLAEVKYSYDPRQPVPTQPEHRPTPA